MVKYRRDLEPNKDLGVQSCCSEALEALEKWRDKKKNHFASFHRNSSPSLPFLPSTSFKAVNNLNIDDIHLSWTIFMK